MDKALWTWIALGAYALVAAWLAYRGYRRTKSLRSFAVGAGDIPPFVVGLSLAAQLTSVATFAVNPGLVFHYGLSGLLGFGLAAGAGIIVGLVIFTRAFRRQGASVAALSVPQWISKRFDSQPMGLGFGIASLALVSYAVLIVVALSHVLAVLLGLPAWIPAAGIIVFVFGTVLLGGVNAHVYTNAIQAAIMLVVALLLIGSGLGTFTEDPGLFTRLEQIDPALVGVTNPGSLYFRNLFEVFVCNGLVGLALVCQPHILSKALYLKDDGQVRRYLGTAIAVGVVFMGVMLVGLYARMELPANTPIDQVVPGYIASHFSSGWQVLVAIGVLCAGISTLEGILLALSTIISADLFLGGLGKRLLSRHSEEARGRIALKVGRYSIVGLGIVTFLLSRWQIENPTGGSVAIFAQYGVYGLTAISFVPLAVGMFLPKARKLAVLAGSLAALVGFVVTGLTGWSFMANNPAFLALVGIVSGWVVFAVAQFATRTGGASVVTPARSV